MEPIQYTKPEHEIDLIEIITILWKARKFIAAVTSISLTIGILYIIFATPMYRSSITLYPAIDTGSSSPMTAMARQLGVSGAATGSGNYNIPDVVKSRTLSEKIVRHEWEIQGFDKEADLVEYFDKLWGVEKPEHIRTKEDSISWHNSKLTSYSQYIAYTRIGVNTNLDTGLITVSVDFEDKKLARDVANFISLFISNWFNESQNENIKQNLEFINERANVLYKELQEAENELKGFKETNRNILNSPDLQLELQRLQRQVTIKQEVYLTLVKQKEVNQIEQNKNSNVVKILDTAIIAYRPFKPQPKRVVLISVIIGLFFSTMLIFLFDIYYRILKRYGYKAPQWLDYIRNMVNHG